MPTRFYRNMLATRHRPRRRWRLLLPMVAAATLGVALPSGAVTLGDASVLQGPASLFHPFPLARIDNAVATVANPAGLAGRASSEFFAIVTDSDDLRDGDSAFLAKLRSLGLGYERYRPFRDSASVVRFTVASGRPISRRIAYGISYAWYFSSDSDLADLSSLDIGLLFRPARRVGLAVTALGYNRPKLGELKLPRLYRAGASVRTIGERLTLFLEGAMDSDQSLADGTGAYGLEVEPLIGIVVRGRADTDGDFRFGFEYNFSQSAYGVAGLYDRNGNSDGRAGYVKLTDVAYRSRGRERGRGRRTR